MPQAAVDEFDALVEELIRRDATNRLAAYAPYPFQKLWHNAEGKDTPGEAARQKALMAANQVGKTWCGAFEVAIHATGLYPDWWKGVRFPHAVNILVAGVSFDRVRDTLQEKLFGEPHDDAQFGTGTIPKDLIVGTPVRKQGYQDTIDSCGIQHVSGGISRVRQQAYEQGFKKFMATGFHVVELDEEPPIDIYSQCLRSITSTRGIINLTFTPEEGVTQVVDGFMNELKEGQALISATWDDAPHIVDNPRHREQLLSALPAHEREMRSRGIPRLGSGAVYPVSDDLLRIEPFEIPIWWPRLAAIDFGGFEHPFGAVWMAFDRDTDTAYVYKTYKGMGSLPIHADALKRQDCTWIPTAWPHDVGRSDPRSGIPLAAVLRDEYGLNMLPYVFSNPPAPGQEEGQGGQGVEVGISNLLTAMETGRLKVFESEKEWFREKGLYHRKATRDGPVRIVKRLDDLMDATRYAYQSQRFADVRPRSTTGFRNYAPQGARNW